MNKIKVRLADWHKDNADIRRIREAVFIAEQNVPPELEWDSDDNEAIHFLAMEDDYAIGTAACCWTDRSAGFPCSRTGAA